MSAGTRVAATTNDDPGSAPVVVTRGLPFEASLRAGCDSLYDPQAEETVAACAAFSRRGATLAAGRLGAQHFHDPRCWAIVAASVDVPDACPPGVDEAEGWWRETTVAETANVWPDTLRDWCRRAPCAWDSAGTFADRVIAAHERRQEANRLLVELAALGIAVTPEVEA